MTKKSILFLAFVTVFLIGVLFFIYDSNDHSECETQVTTTMKPSGEKITLTHHICKERFNF